MYSLGLAKKTRDKYAPRTAVDAIDEKYDTCAEFLNNLFEYLYKSPAMADLNLYINQIDDSLDRNKKYTEFSIFYHNHIGNICLLFYPLDNVFDRVIFKVCVSNFPGFSYATFYFIQIDNKFFLTNNYDLFKNNLEEEDRYTLLYDMSKSSIIEITKAIELLLANDEISMKGIADALMNSGNICSGNLALYDLTDKNVIQYHHDSFSCNASDSLIQDQYISDITLCRGKEEFLKHRYKIKSISKIDSEKFKERYEAYQQAKKSFW